MSKLKIGDIVLIRKGNDRGRTSLSSGKIYVEIITEPSEDIRISFKGRDLLNHHSFYYWPDEVLSLEERNGKKFIGGYKVYQDANL